MILNKNKWNDLAIFGNPPAFEEELHVNKPYAGDKRAFLGYVEQLFASKQFTNNGPLVQRLEAELRQTLKVKHCLLTSNGTMALALIVKALNLSGEVIIPSFSFISTAHLLEWQGITPVFCDISRSTWNIDPEHCESLISEHTSAIIGTHLWGRGCDVESLKEVAERRDLYLLFDAAHGFGCSKNRVMIGNFGHAEALSFHATKVFHTFEGGAVTTNDDELADKIDIMRNFGFTGYDVVDSIGINAKMPEVSAAMGLANIANLEEQFVHNEANYEIYWETLSNVPGCQILEYDKRERNNFHYIVVQIDPCICDLSRDQVMKVLHKENVIARRYFFPGNHRMKPYVSQTNSFNNTLSETDFISDRVLVLPNGSSINKDHILEICNLISLTVNNADKLRLAT